VETKKSLTYKKARFYFKYDLLTGKVFWKVSPANRVQIGDEVGWVGKRGYREVHVCGVRYYVHRVVWLLCYGYFPENGIDHIDRNPTNNRIENLREVSQQCNLRNYGNPSDNTSGVKGVCWVKGRKRWAVSITVLGQTYHIGSHKSFDEAVLFRLAAEQCLDWSDCSCQSPAYKYAKEKNLIGNMRD